MGKIFLSYRRRDAVGHTRLLYQALRARFPGQVFLDVGGDDGIPPGRDFEQHLESVLAHTDVLLAIIGPGWLDASDERGRRRLDQPRDHLRIEIATALRQGLDVFPVLVGGARMPTADELPGDLRELARLQAHQLVDDHGWDHDVKYLAEAIRRTTERRTAVRALVAALVAGAALLWPARAAGTLVIDAWEMHREQFGTAAAAVRLGLSHGASFALVAAGAALAASAVIRGTRSAGTAVVMGALAGAAGGMAGGALDQVTRARTTLELGLLVGFAVTGAIAASGRLVGFTSRAAIAGAAAGGALGALLQAPLNDRFLAFAIPALLIVAGAGIAPLALRGPAGRDARRRDTAFSAANLPATAELDETVILGPPTASHDPHSRLRR